MSHIGVKKNICFKKWYNNFNFPYTGLYKSVWVHYVLWLEMAGRVFSVELRGFLFFFYS